MTATSDVLDLYRRHLGVGSARMARYLSSEVMERAEGNYLYTAAGERYLCCGGFSVFLTGHQHPEIVGPVTEQLQRMALCGPTIVHDGHARAAKALADACDERLEYVFFLNSGAEATELAIKLARLNGKRRLIAARNGYHGKTTGALSVTGRDVFRTPFEPLLPDVTFVPFDDVAAIADAVSEDSCVILEPIQAEGGVRVPDPGYLREVARLCASRGALLILDEIQTGLGRTGEMWGAQRAEVCPDILLSGKALGGGVMPVSALIATEQVFAPLGRDPVLHTSTNSGNPLAMAAVLASLDVIGRYDVPARARDLGHRLEALLHDTLGARCPHLVTEIRGAGLLLGIELREPKHAAELILELTERRVLVTATLNTQSTVRLTPSAFLDDEGFAWLRSALTEAADALAERHPNADDPPRPASRG